MSESISNVVASLKNVRNDYQSKLTSVPQYAAVLDVEALIGKVESALGGSSADEGTDVAKSVVRTLKSAQTQYLSLLETVKEYNALKSIDKLIAELDAPTVQQPKTPAEAISAVTTEPDLDDTEKKIAAALDTDEQDTEHSVTVAAEVPAASHLPQTGAHVAETSAQSVAERPSSGGFAWQAASPSVAEQAPTTITEHPPSTPEGAERAA